MGIKETDTYELLDRYTYLMEEKYGPLALDLYDKLQKFGKYRQELSLISEELLARGLTPDEPEELKKQVEKIVEDLEKDVTASPDK